MQRISSSGTKPEQKIAALLRKLNYPDGRGRAVLPGRPDFIFVRWKKVIFVHGCFWHRHKRCKRSTMPSRNVALWREKFRKTILRDKRSIIRLRSLGWGVLVVWECELNNRGLASISGRLTRFLAKK